MRSLFVFLVALASALAEITVDVDRTISLQTQNARHESKLTVTNAGKEPVTHLDIAFEKPITGKTAWTRVVHNKRALRMIPAENLSTKALATGADVVSVKLTDPLAPGESTKLIVKQVITHGQTPSPASVGQSEDQFMIYEHNAYYTCPYKVTSQKTTVKTPGPIDSVSETVSPQTKTASSVTFGPLTDTEPYKVAVAREHYMANVPFLTVYKMVREITVSHWGRTKVEEIIKMRHDGAKLKGFFSRVDYQKRQHLPNNGAPAAIRSWSTKIPSEARDVEYRDDVGNISTSDLRHMTKYQQLDLRPRFPIFGGWYNDYMLNYTVPADLFLSNTGTHYQLKAPFLSHVFDGAVVDDFELRVVLPEGAENIAFKLKFGVDEESRDVKATYLDTTGRPVVVIKKNNLVDEHQQDFEITYDFDSMTLYNEPILLILAFFAFFTLAIIIRRLDLSITEDVVEAKKKQN